MRLSRRESPPKAPLWLQTLHHAGKRHGFAHVMCAADPGDRAFDTHAKAGMRHRSVAAEIQVPVEGLQRQAVFYDALLQSLIVVLTLAATDNLAVTFRCEHVDA